jgi:integrase
MYRHQGRLRRLTLGTYPILSLVDARDLAKTRLADVQRGLDPGQQKQDARDAVIFAALAERYLAEHARMKKRAASIHEDERILKRELLPTWEHRKAESIARREVIALVDAIALRAPIVANRTLALISKVFNFAVSKEIVALNPAFRVPRPGTEKTRDRVLSDDEVKRFWRALDEEPSDLAALFKVLLLTGQRRSEVVEMPWSEIDLDTGWWNIPAARSKNKRSHRVPLVGLALEILKARKASAEGEVFVFPGRYAGQPYINLAKPLARIVDRANAGAGQGATTFTIHDLRRTAATGMAKAGVPGAIISKVLNHVSASTGASKITMVYDRYSYDKEKAFALLKWDAHLTLIVEGDSEQALQRKVVALG